MKLATINDSTRDGKLVVVNKQLTQAIAVPDIARTMQQALDNWANCAPRLEAVYQQLNDGKCDGTQDFKSLTLSGVDMTFDFPTLIAHAAKTRKLGAGTIIGSGTVSNYDRSKGSSCIAEVRMLETLQHGKPTTPFMKAGDTVRIEMFDHNNQSIFGAIEQTVVLVKEPVTC